MQRDMWFRGAANDYYDALPIGNGRMGAMPLGGVYAERINLNEDTLWSGYARGTAIHNAYDRYTKQLRKKLLREGDPYAAETLADKLQGPFSESFIPAGELVLDMAHKGEFSGYARGLSLADGVAWTEYDVSGVRFTRKMFVSAPDQVIVLRLEADALRAISLRGHLESMCRHECKGFADRYALKGRAPRHVAPTYLENETAQPVSVVYDEKWEKEKGLDFECHVRLVAEGGRVRADAEGFSVADADALTLLLWIGTDYNARRFDADGELWQGNIRGLDMEGEASRVLQNAASLGYAALEERHARDHRALFDRVSLTLPASPDAAALPTDERKARYLRGETDTELEKLFFDFGRYLLIDSSRPGTQAANLQGIWCWQMRPAWSCNYTTNINAQMNYWGAEVLNLSQCHMPFMDFLREISITGADTAANLYNARGWCVHHNTDLWRITCPIGLGHSDSKWSLWPTAGTWICQHIWEHYLFTRDTDFLRAYYPVLRGAALFAIDMCVPDGKGHLAVCPATVPENRYTLPNGDQFTVGAGASMDYQMMSDLFDCVTEAAGILGGDEDTVAEIARARAQFPDIFPIEAKDGSLKDWQFDAQCDTRFINILYGLYPGRLISPVKTPELMDAVRNTLRALDKPRDLFANGWSAAMHARLGDAETAYARIRHHIARVTRDNLMGKNSEEYQIDTNLGGIAGMAEMLLQSHDGFVDLLPALPEAWRDGAVSGLRARGGYTVDMRWENGALTEARVTADSDGTLRVRTRGGETRQMRALAGVPVTVTP